jgi:Ca2+-binding RTX toxin-like protein
MATIPGSHFTVTAGAVVNIVETTTGTGLPAPVAGDFNLEVYVGSLANAPPLAPGYQGLAVLTAGGLQLDLLSGTYAVTDNGTGNDTLDAFGTNETISGGSNNVTLNVNGPYDVAVGGGQDTISVNGNFDTVNGQGNDLINVNNSLNTISGGAGNDTINVYGSVNLVDVGGGSDTVNIFGSFDTVEAGMQSPNTAATVSLFGNFDTFVDGPNTYSDTVVGFSQSAGDKIQLGGSNTASYAVAHATPQGADTLITLNDGSTILLKGIAHIDSSFFS